MKTKKHHSLISLPVLILFFLTLFMASPAYSDKPSFDCSKATTKIEKEICGSKRWLSIQDNEMAGLYNQLYKELDEKNKAALKLDQKEWLKNRDKCIDQSDIHSCLAKKYGLRNKELIEKIKKLSYTGNPDIVDKRGIYVLIKKDYIVRYTKSKLCEEMGKNLNSFGDEPPMVCECKINSDFTDLSLPDWKPVDINNYIDIIETRYKTVLSLSSKSKSTIVEERWEKIKSDLLKRIENNQANAWEAYFDIDNNGDVEHVIRVLLYKCKFEESNYVTGYHPILLVVNDQNNSLDITYKNIFKGFYNAFFYKGETYLTSWSIGKQDFTNRQFYIKKPQNALDIPSPGITYCVYRYIKFK